MYNDTYKSFSIRICIISDDNILSNINHDKVIIIFFNTTVEWLWLRSYKKISALRSVPNEECKYVFQLEFLAAILQILQILCLIWENDGRINSYTQLILLSNHNKACLY